MLDNADLILIAFFIFIVILASLFERILVTLDMIIESLSKLMFEPREKPLNLDKIRKEVKNIKVSQFNSEGNIL